MNKATKISSYNVIRHKSPISTTSRRKTGFLAIKANYFNQKLAKEDMTIEPRKSHDIESFKIFR